MYTERGIDTKKCYVNEKEYFHYMLISIFAPMLSCCVTRNCCVSGYRAKMYSIDASAGFFYMKN